MQDIRFNKYFIDYTDPLSEVKMLRYKNFSTKAGFQIEYYDDEPTVVFYKNQEEFFGFLYALTPQLSELPNEEEKIAFIQYMVEGYQRIVPELPNGLIKMEFYFAKFIVKKQQSNLHL